MGLTLKDLKDLLEKDLHWEYDKSGTHPRYRFIVNGRIVAATHYSHSWSGRDQISYKMLMLIANQMHCDLKTLKALLQDKKPPIKDYYKGLLQRGLITPEEYNSLCTEK